MLARVLAASLWSAVFPLCLNSRVIPLKELYLYNIASNAVPNLGGPMDTSTALIFVRIGVAIPEHRHF